MEHTLTEPRTGAQERVKSKNRVRHGFGFALAMLGAVILSLALLLASLHIVAFQPSHYRTQYERLNVPVATRIAMPELMQVTGVMLDYLRGDAPTMQTTATIDGVYREVFTERELMHMDDVRSLMLLARRVMLPAFIAGALCVLLSLLMCYGHARRTFKGLAWGAGLLVGALGAIVLLAVLNFNALFTRFHLIFFTNDLWLLDPASSVLINMVPLDFFVATASRIAIFWAVMFVLSVVVGIWMALCFTEKQKIARKAGVNAPKASIENFIEAGLETPDRADAKAGTVTDVIEAQTATPLPPTEASVGDGAQEAEEPQTFEGDPAADAPETQQPEDARPEAEWAVVTVAGEEGERFVIDRPTGTRPDAQSIFERFGLPDEDDAAPSEPAPSEEPAQPEPSEQDGEPAGPGEPGNNGGDGHDDEKDKEDDAQEAAEHEETDEIAEAVVTKETIDIAEETVTVAEETVAFEEILIGEEAGTAEEPAHVQEPAAIEEAVAVEAIEGAEEMAEAAGDEEAEAATTEAAATEPAMLEEQPLQTGVMPKQAEGGLRWFSSVMLPDDSVPVAEVEDEIPDPDDLIAYWNQVREARRLGLPQPEMPKPRPKPQPVPEIEETPVGEAATEDGFDAMEEASDEAAETLEEKALKEAAESFDERSEEAAERVEAASEKDTEAFEGAFAAYEETSLEVTGEEAGDAQPIDAPIEDIDDAATLLDRLAPLIGDSDEAARLLAQLRKLL